MSTYVVTATAGSTSATPTRVGGLTRTEAQQLSAVLHLDTAATITVARECPHPALLLPLALLFLLAGVTLIFGPGAFGESLSYVVAVGWSWLVDAATWIWTLLTQLLWVRFIIAGNNPIGE